MLGSCRLPETCGRLLVLCIVLHAAADVRAQDADEVVVLDEAEPVTVEAEALQPGPAPGAETVQVQRSHQSLTDTLDAISGVRVMRSGGEGAASQLSVQGLQGRRVATWLGPVRLDDPATGVLDLSELPAAALQEATLVRGASPLSEGSLGGVLLLRPAPPTRPTLRGSVRLGAERLLMLDVSAGAPFVVGPVVAGVLASARASTTNGQFDYTPVIGSVDEPQVLKPRTRINNDRHRAGFTLVAAGEWLGGPSANAVLDVATMEGGIPGYGVQPLPNARESQTRIAAGVEVRGPEQWTWQPALQLSARQAAWRYRDTSVPGALQGSLLTTSVSAVTTLSKALAPGLWLTGALHGWLDAARSNGASGAYDALRPMAASHVTMRAVGFGGRLRTDASLRMQGYVLQPSRTNLKSLQARSVLLPEVRGELVLVPGISVHAAAGRAFRAPSLEELYRPANARLAGNPALFPEDGVESSVGVHAAVGPLSGRITAYGARMFNQIAYVNINAFDVRPENVGDVWRAGGSVDGRVSFSQFGEWTAGADVNLTRVTATGAPLPSVPWLEGRSELLLGPPRARLLLRALARTGASGMASGELPIRPAARFDAGVVLVPLPGVQVRALLRNLTDDKSQTDVWGVPQPGREASVQVAFDPGAALAGEAW